MVAMRLAGQAIVWTLDGVQFNVYDDETGEMWVVPIDQVEGWFGQPGVELGGMKRPGDHGGTDGRSFFVPRVITMTGWAKFNGRAEMLAGIDRLGGMASDTSQLHALLAEDEVDTNKIAYVRLADGVKILPGAEHTIDFQMILTAPEARKLSAVEQQVDLYLPLGTAGGFFAPFEAPFFADLPAEGTGEAVVYNNGNFPTKPVITVTGPVTNPTISNLTADKFIGMDFDLLAGDWLDFDFVNRAVLLNGTAGRTGSLSVGSEWWEILKGANTIRYSAVTGTAASVMTIRYRDAWIG